MPHIVKISQRRESSGLVPELVIYRFRHERKSGRHASESVDGMRRNRWTACVGIGGRHGSDSVDGMRRITH